MIIGITGKISSGKDTFAEILENEFGYKRDSLAAPIKRLVSDTFVIPFDIVEGRTKESRIKREINLENWDGWSVRALLQFIGTELFRDRIDKDIWAKSLVLRINKIKNADIVIPDIRFPNEKNILFSSFGDDFVVIKVVRKTNDYSSKDIASHESEIYNIDSDYTIFNDSTLDSFRDKARSLIKLILEKKNEQ